MKTAILALSILASTPAFARVTCSAQNLRGGVFTVTGLLPGPVQQRAMNVCRANSASCRPLGCRFGF